MSPVQATSPAAQQAMQTLTEQWYNAVVQGCTLSSSTFQLAPGAPNIGQTSEQLWNIFDALPPVSVSHYWNPAQISSFASEYSAVVSNLLYNDQKFTDAMGDYLSEWQTYLKTSPTIPSGGIVELFHDWEQLNMPADQGQEAYVALEQSRTNPIVVAQQMVLAAQNASDPVYAYNATIDQLHDALTSQSEGCGATLSSDTASSDVTSSWAQSAGGVFFDFFMGGGETNWDSVTQQVADAGVEIDAQFKQRVTFPAGPLSAPSQDPILSRYTPWYWSAALNQGYQNNNAFVWGSGNPSWDDAFGPSGAMRYFTTDLVVVSGVTVTMTSAADFDADTQASIQTSKAYGFFPFFAAESQGGWSHNFEFHDSGGLTVTSSAPDGYPVLLGVDVTSVASAFGGGS